MATETTTWVKAEALDPGVRYETEISVTGCDVLKIPRALLLRLLSEAGYTKR